MNIFKLLLSVFLFGLTSSCVSSKKSVLSNGGRESKSVSGDINVYSKTEAAVSQNANGKVGSVRHYIVYKIQKGDNGKKVSLNVKNLLPMIDNYAPSIELINKFNKVNNVNKVWRTANLLTILGGVAMITVGSISLAKVSEDKGGGGLLLGGFGVIGVGGISGGLSNRSDEKNTLKLLEAVKLYNNRVK
ncbi:MAG: hypothetical protein MUE72_07125 [Chitinophagaceae bacterium]|jgi:hypothetical protein|nr:hypothetical protein [Chitinophagaceae bacterium]